MKWFDNPRKRRKPSSRRRKSKRRPPKGFKNWKTYMASIRPKGKHMARRKRKSSKRRPTARRRRRRSAVAVVRSNPRRTRSRSVRRFRRRHNPRFSIRGLMNSAMQGAQDGLWIIGGKAVTNAIPSMLGLSTTGALGIGIKALSAIGAGFVFGFVSQNAAKLATAAGFAAIYEPFIKGLNLPIISAALADDDDGYGSYPSLSAYPDEVGSLAAYPQAVGVGQDDYAMQY